MTATLAHLYGGPLDGLDIELTEKQEAEGCVQVRESTWPKNRPSALYNRDAKLSDQLGKQVFRVA
jgi:hypothetical protein